MSALAVMHAAQDDQQNGARNVTLDPDEQKMILAMVEEILRRRQVEKRRKQE